MAMIAAASMTHDKGFHINPKNFKILLSCERYVSRLMPKYNVSNTKKDMDRHKMS